MQLLMAIRSAVLASGAALLPIAAGCVQHVPSTCKKVSINSAGAFQFRATRLLAIATGSGGLGSVANYVIISPPPDASDEKIIVMADVSPTRAPLCRYNPHTDTVLNCSVSLPDYKLRVLVNFSVPGNEQSPHNYVVRTREIASYVEKDVLCGK